MTIAPSRPRVDREAVLAALGSVQDPELHESVTRLGFVGSVEVGADGVAEVHLRLPTFFCAPNFAWLMVADAHDAVSAVPGVRAARVVLDDHFAAEPINAGVAARAGFTDAFEGEALAELDTLRADFLRKAVLAGTDVVCRGLLAAGHPADTLTSLTLGDAPAGEEIDHLVARRLELGIGAGDDDPLLVDVATGEALAPAEVPLHLRKARLTQVGVEANVSLCSGQLAHRYPDSTPTPRRTSV